MVAVIKTMKTRAHSHSGMSIQYCTIFAPAIASKPTTITHKYQYSQPTEKPAQLPNTARRQESTKNPPRRWPEAVRMFISRASHWVLGTAMAAALLYFGSVATAETVADAFEPDLESWEALG